MLRHTFCHVPGIGVKKELTLWQAGITSWDDAIRAGGDAPPEGASALRNWPLLSDWIERSCTSLEAGDARFFARGLPSSQIWRLFPDFRDSVAYVDIETTGLRVPPSIITTIALYDGRSVRHYINGVNLADFARDVMDYRVLVTYNGKTFDAPAIERFFGIRLAHAHIDLRYVLASLGLRGGLKGCERRIGLDRGDLDGIDGFFAVILWEEYARTGDPKALETLLAYNIQDVLNLEVLMAYAYNGKVKETPLGDGLTPVECRPAENPFRPDPGTIGRLRRAFIDSWSRW